jgi:hypothetical protein
MLQLSQIFSPLPPHFQGKASPSASHYLLKKFSTLLARQWHPLVEGFRVIQHLASPAEFCMDFGHELNCHSNLHPYLL